MADLIKRQTVITQLNEKISSTEYDIVLPETRADVVKETFGSTVVNWAPSTPYRIGDIVSYNESTYECKVQHTSAATFNGANWDARLRRRFVTPADETEWNGGGSALKYKGTWSSAVSYKLHDVVKLTSGGVTEYFIAIAASTNKSPDIAGDTAYWANLNIWATNAKNADFVKTIQNEAGVTSHYLTFVDSNNSANTAEQLYTDSGLRYIPSENKLYTTSEFAEKYKRTFSNARSATPVGAGDIKIDDEFKKVYENIDALYGGVGGTLTLQKNGTTIGEYDPSADETIDITIASTDVTDWTSAVKTTGATAFVRYDQAQTLTDPQKNQARVNINAQIAGDYAHLVNGKVPSEELPDWILGQMDFGGVVLLGGANNGKVESGQDFFNDKTLAKVLTPSINPWVANTSYVVNNYVTYNEMIYRFKSSYSGSTFNYTVVDALPTKVYFNENNKGTFSTGTAYAIGNVVLYNGTYYVFHTVHPVGAWNASHVVPIWNSVIAQQCNGTYFIVKADTSRTGTIVDENVAVGDWILSNGDMNWSIIENTDAVTMVNGQIGAVETYKGVWSSSTPYFMGDWVKYDNTLYIATATTNNTNKLPSAVGSTYWQVAGRIYTATDAIKLDGTVFKHDVTRLQDVLTSETVSADGGIIYNTSETLDSFGHSTQTTRNTITLSQTWRAVQVKGTSVIADTDNTPLNFVDGNQITAAYTDKTVKFNHNTGKTPRTSVTSQAVANDGTVTFITAGNDDYGHVNAHLNQTLSNIVNMDGTQTITGIKTFDNHIYAGTNNSWDIGSAATKFRNIYATTLNGSLVGGADKWTNARAFQINVRSGLKSNGTTNIEGSASNNVDGSANVTWTITLGNSGVGDAWGVGVESATYSAVQVNKQGVIVGGAQSIEFGHVIGEGPSAGLAVGGLFFRRVAAPAL